MVAEILGRVSLHGRSGVFCVRGGGGHDVVACVVVGMRWLLAWWWA